MKRVVLAGAIGALSAAAVVHAANEPKSCSNTPIVGATTALDPTHKGHLRTAGAGQASTCGAPGVAPAVQDPAIDYHYRSYTFRNWTGAAACMTFDIVYRACDFAHGECAPPPDGSCAEGGCGGVGLHEAAAYLGAFDPNDIRLGYLGDSGFLSGGPGRDVFSVNAPAGADVVLVVTWAGPVAPAFEPHYSMTVTGCGQPSEDAAVDAGVVDAGIDAGPKSPTASWPRPTTTPPPAQPADDDDDDDAPDAAPAPKKDAGPKKRTSKAAPTTEEASGCNTSGGASDAAIGLGLFATALIVRRRKTMTALLPRRQDGHDMRG
jgi:uncharacterized protein (TIGR03382 family)